ASDACESHGLTIATLEPGTMSALRAFLPKEASTRNPVDMIASASPDSFEKAVRLVASDPGVDALMVLYVPPIVTRPLDVAQAIVRGAEAATRDAAARGETPKPVLTCFMGSHGVPEGLRSLQDRQIPSYAFPESAAIALARVARYGRWKSAPEGQVPTFVVDEARAQSVLVAARTRAGSGTAWLTPEETRGLLTAYGLAMPDSRVAHDAESAAAAARAIGFPVALKLVSASVTHKSDVGGV